MSKSEKKWAVEDFQALKQELISNPNEAHYINVFKQLIEIKQDHIDSDCWLDCKDLIKCLLKQNCFINMLENEPELFRSAIEVAPPLVIRAIVEMIISDHSIYNTLTNSICFAFLERMNDAETSEYISTLIARLCTRSAMIDHLLDQFEKNIISDKKFNFYQILLSSIQSGTYDEKLSPIFRALKNEMQSSDVLMSLAAFDILCDIAISGEQGAELLIEFDVPQKAYEIMTSSRESPDGGFLFSSAIKFFGCLCRCHPEALIKFSEFLPMISHMIANYDLLDASQRVLVVETFCHASFSSKGKNIISEHYGTFLPVILKSITNALKTGPTELKARTLDSLAILLQNGEDILLNKWFNLLEGLVEALDSFLLMPFRDTKRASLNVLLVLATRDFAVRSLFTPRSKIEEFKLFLTTTESENDWEIYKIKQDFVQELLNRKYSFIDPTLLENFKILLNGYKYEPQIAID